MKDQRRYLYAVMILLLLTLLLIPSPAAVRAEDGETPPFERTEPDDVAAAARAPSADDARTAAAGVPPLIDVWYGTNQIFGRLGNPQRWINIPGKVTDGNGVASLKYALNGDPQNKLSIGPDGRRLVSRGDFNIDIDRAKLNSGLNTVVITARDTQGNASTETVTLEYQPGNVWPQRYSIDWSEVAEIQDVAQVVDGQWRITSKGLRTQVAGYDRLVAIGDVAWTDYEVQVPVTVHSVQPSGSPGVGLLLRWKGHTNDPVSDWQPRSGWWPLGAIGWYRWKDTGNRYLQIYGNQGRKVATTGARLRTGTRYYFKMRVETRQGKGSYYRLKVWEAHKPEPSSWTLHGQESLNDPRVGFFLLLAHRADVTFGDVQVRPLGGVYTLAVETVGQGSVDRDPSAAAYAQGEVVRLTPTPLQGWQFDGWSGADAGALEDHGDGSWSIEMARDRVVTATFSPGCTSLALQVEPQDAGSIEPGRPSNCGEGGYTTGTQLQLTALPSEGYTLSHWSGDLSGRANPETLAIDGDMAVTAHFVESAGTYEEGFDGYASGADPESWYDTAAGNSMEEDNGLFHVHDLEGNNAFGTTSSQRNIHTHYVGGGSDGWANTRFRGRMKMTSPASGLGLTFYSKYADQDVYYRLRRYGSSDFHLAPHPHDTVILGGDTGTGVVPRPDLWYWFLVEVENAGARTEIRAKVWPQGAAEPEEWQAEAWHSGAGRLTSGRIGLWGHSSGSKYWDDLLIEPMAPPPIWKLMVAEVGHGVVTAEPGQVQYADGQQVKLMATGAPGWRFDGWGGDLSGSVSPLALTMDGDKMVEAHFVQEAFALHLETSGDGKVALTPDHAYYAETDLVELAAKGVEGWRFDHWEGDLTGSANPASLTLDSTKRVKAIFVREQYTLRAQVAGSGQVWVVPHKAHYTHGDVVQIEAIPDSGWSFSRWSGDLSGHKNPETRVIRGDTTVTATFEERTMLYSEDFEDYQPGADPAGWLDTKAENSMEEDPRLFHVYDLEGNRAFGTTSTQRNIHSHYVGPGSEGWSGIRFRGRMLMTSARSGLGVTIYSKYADRDVYYRLRCYGTHAFGLAPHPHDAVLLAGDTGTGVRPRPNVWHWFVMEVEELGTQTEIRAKVWPQGTAEPVGWQIQARHSGAGRLTDGRIGLWSHSSGSKYWDDIVVEPVGWPSDDF